MTRWFVVVRATPAQAVPSSKPRQRKEQAMRDLTKLRAGRQGTDFRIAALDVPDVAPYSDHWPSG